MFSVLISCFNCVSHDGNLGWLLFTQTTRMEIFYINIKLQNLTRWENYLYKVVSKSAEQTKMSRKIALPKITAYFC